jgi:hypothetical protein
VQRQGATPWHPCLEKSAKSEPIMIPIAKLSPQRFMVVKGQQYSIFDSKYILLIVCKSKN